MGTDMVPVITRVYDDRTFDLTFKTPPASDLIMKAIKIDKGSGKNKISKVGSNYKSSSQRNRNPKDARFECKYY